MLLWMWDSLVLKQSRGVFWISLLCKISCSFLLHNQIETAEWDINSLPLDIQQQKPRLTRWSRSQVATTVKSQTSRPDFNVVKLTWGAMRRKSRAWERGGGWASDNSLKLSGILSGGPCFDHSSCGLAAWRLRQSPRVWLRELAMLKCPLRRARGTSPLFSLMCRIYRWVYHQLFFLFGKSVSKLRIFNDQCSWNNHLSIPGTDAKPSVGNRPASGRGGGPKRPVGCSWGRSLRNQSGNRGMHNISYHLSSMNRKAQALPNDICKPVTLLLTHEEHWLFFSLIAHHDRELGSFNLKDPTFSLTITVRSLKMWGRGIDMIVPCRYQGFASKPSHFRRYRVF